jgi:hypothetical protein
MLSGPLNLFQTGHGATEYALFACTERSDLDDSHKRKETETDFIGAYYLKVEEAPLTQCGHTENNSLHWPINFN